MGSDPVLSGQIRLTGQIRLPYEGVCPWNTRPRHLPAGARRPRAHREAGWAVSKIRPNSRIQIRKHFSFSKPFYKLQINLNFNVFYSHNKIQE
jgi:hypothetical protein